MTDKLKSHWLNKRFHWGLLKLTRHSLALLGLVSLASVLFFASQPAWRLSASLSLLSWLDARQDGASDISATGPADVLVHAKEAAGPWALSEQQEAVTRGLSRRFKLSPEPLGSLVSEAWLLGDRIQVSPTLLLAVMAIESRFNPFASGAQGGMGLMQIEPQAQHLALLPFGGPLVAFDPLTNLRVGAQHLQTLIEQSASVEAALLLYATATGQRNSADYTHRVLAEQKLLDNMVRASKRMEVAQNSRLQTRPALN
ncbi:transglycosylase SLT domain-containing protein [Limnohabitans sp.]|uniref:transglycosylase SLT domain-containing protein n=1 Tax=Limnohabitans sp. TaxID=1907725 RepID=UPI0039BC8BFC|nr:lytic transglycosylase domain-containing protein [Comamonadaceae bacterium]